MSDNLMDKVTALGERLKIGGSEVTKKMSAGMSSMSFKVKELFQGPNQVDKLVEEATSESLNQPDWSLYLEICDMINTERVNSVEVIRGIKRRIVMRSPRVQFLSLVLLETCVKNCEKAFSEVAAERVLDEMVKVIDDPLTVVDIRNKVLALIEAWGESTSELRYLPIYEQTYKSLKSRGIQFPGRDTKNLAPIFTPQSVSTQESDANLADQFHDDVTIPTLTPEQTKEAFDVARNSVELLTTVLSSSPQQDGLKDDLTTTLVQQCRQSQYTVQRIIETDGDDEALLFEALNINDEIQKVLQKYEEMHKPVSAPTEPEPAMIPIAVESSESTAPGKEDSLVRKPSGHRGGASGGSHGDMMDDLNEMVFGNKSGSSSEGGGRDPKKQQLAKDDLISF